MCSKYSQFVRSLPHHWKFRLNILTALDIMRIYLNERNLILSYFLLFLHSLSLLWFPQRGSARVLVSLNLMPLLCWTSLQFVGVFFFSFFQCCALHENRGGCIFYFFIISLHWNSYPVTVKKSLVSICIYYVKPVFYQVISEINDKFSHLHSTSVSFTCIIGAASWRWPDVLRKANRTCSMNITGLVKQENWRY